MIDTQGWSLCLFGPEVLSYWNKTDTLFVFVLLNKNILTGVLMELSLQMEISLAPLGHSQSEMLMTSTGTCSHLIHVKP